MSDSVRAVILACSSDYPKTRLMERTLYREVQDAHVACTKLIVRVCEDIVPPAPPPNIALKLVEEWIKKWQLAGFNVELYRVPTRNIATFTEANRLIAFWNGFDEHTIEVIRRVTQAHIQTEIHPA